MAAMNPFEIFGLKPQFRIDKQKLDEKYFEIQKKVHPDRFASASDTEKRVAQQWATLINDAFQKLSDPIQRGKALCALRGHLIDEDSSGSISEEFLLEQLERREAISDAKDSGNTAHFTDFFDVLNDADFIVDGHHGNQGSIRTHGFGQSVEVQKSALADVHVCHFKAFAFKFSHGVQHGFVFGLYRD